VFKGKQFYRTAEDNCTRIVYQPAPRGIIFDCLGRIVADNYPSFALYYTPTTYESEMEDNKKMKLIADIEKIEKIINIRLDNVKKMKRVGLIRITSNLSREQMFTLLERGIDLRNFILDIEYKRRYRYHSVGAHILGYLGIISKGEYNSLRGNYRMDSLIGKAGIEKAYDKFLRGEDGGFLVQVDVRGSQIKILDKIPPKPGNNIYLTIDWELQQFIEEEMKDLRGAVVAMDPSDGKVLALVSLPSFDPNIFVTGLADNDVSIRNFLSDPKYPLLNRAMNGLYPPGSVYKIITAAAGIDSGKIKPERQFFCPGFFILGSSKKVFRCWKEEGHNVVSFMNGFSQSCDVYFYNLGLICGINLLEEYGKKFLIDKPLQTDIGYIQPGIVPSEKWKQEKYKSPWFDGDTVNVAIGQGYVLTTPMGLCNLACMIANRGSLYRPYFVKKIVSPSGTVIYEAVPKKIHELQLKPETYKIIIEAMEKVVTQGTGYAAYIPGIRVAGKTGTAQNPLGKDHALFIAFAPVDNPKIALSVVIEHGGRGGAVAAPLARKILQKFFNILSSDTSMVKGESAADVKKMDTE
jgi:penicillin-binding protein 2